jgi:hypothetical protein
MGGIAPQSPPLSVCEYFFEWRKLTLDFIHTYFIQPVQNFFNALIDKLPVDNLPEATKTEFLDFILAHKITSIVIFFPFALYLILFVVTSFKKVIERFFVIEWRRHHIRPYVALAIAALLSYTVVDYIAQKGIPVPSVVYRPQAVSELTSFLTWDPVPPKPGYAIHYIIESSPDGHFTSGATHIARTSDIVTPITCANCTSYYRVGVVMRNKGTGALRYGPWSETQRIDQYADTVERVQATKVLRVLVDYSYGRSFLRYQRIAHIPDPQTNENVDVPYHAGYESQLAYDIAYALCQKIFEHKGELTDQAAPERNSGETFKCLPSLDVHVSAFGVPKTTSGQRSKTTSGQRSADKSPAPKPVRVSVEFIPMQRRDLYARLASGDFDLALSDITYVPLRRAQYRISFSNKMYYKTGHAILFYGPQAPDHCIDFSENPTAETLFMERLKKKTTVLVVKDTTSEMCLLSLQARLKKQLKLDEAPFAILNMALSSEAVGLINETPEAGFLISDQSFAEGIMSRKGGKEASSVANTKCVTLSPGFFGDDAETENYCKAQEYRAVVRPGQERLKAVIDQVLGELNQNGLAKAAAHEENCFKAYQDPQAPREPGCTGDETP